MKYMGSKLSLLRNGLGDDLVLEAARGKRFIDLFAGTGRVAWHVAERADVPVLAVDLQQYAVILAKAVVLRDGPIDVEEIVTSWLVGPQRDMKRTEAYKASRLGQTTSLGSAEDVLRARSLCESIDAGPIWRSYGGHYFSPLQASIFDSLISSVPTDSKAIEALCRASLVLAASKCAAAPGHTAQPFQPTPTALPYIQSSWSLDPIRLVAESLRAVGPKHAKVIGDAVIADANEVAAGFGDGDVVFVDPPYSSVHYSRFYHVLESVAIGGCGEVSGAGRYPPPSERPKSRYSIKTQARSALLDLLEKLGSNGCHVVLTFPQGDTSNGLNGEQIAMFARDWFSVDAKVVASRFSTMGGNGTNRSARRRAGELVLTMRPN